MFPDTRIGEEEMTRAGRLAQSGVRLPLGIAQALCSLSPVFVLPLAVLIEKERASARGLLSEPWLPWLARRCFFCTLNDRAD